MPPFSPSHAIESLNTYFAPLGLSTRRVNTAIASVVEDLLSERLEAEIRGRLDSLTVDQLLLVHAAVQPEPLPSVRCDLCGRFLPRPPAPCPCTLPIATNPVTDLTATKPIVTAPLSDLLPGGNKARKPHRSK